MKHLIAFALLLNAALLGVIGCQLVTDNHNANHQAYAADKDEIFRHMSIVYMPTDDKRGKAKTIRFTGVNVQIVNGTNDTRDLNGLGNLIVGYQEMRGDDNDPTTENKNDRSGSHNIVVGWGNNYSITEGLVVGWHNTISGSGAIVAGGGNNTASGKASSVGGGFGNTASGAFSIVSGGQENMATAYASTISGGYRNMAEGRTATVSGGLKNKASGVASIVSGGSKNTASGTCSTVSGGLEKKAAEDGAHLP